MISKIRTAMLLSLLAVGAAPVGTRRVASAPTSAHASAPVSARNAQGCPIVRIVPERLPDLTTPRSGHSIFYANGELTVAGGHTTNFVPTQTAEYFADGKWHQMPMAYCHDNGFAVVRHTSQPDKEEVIIGGGHAEPLGIGQTFMVECYRPETHTFEGFGCLDRKRTMANATQLADGRVIIAGNHYADDAIACYNGSSQILHVRDVAQGYNSPWILHTAHDDAIVVGSRNTRQQPLDTIWATPVGTRRVASAPPMPARKPFRVTLLEQYRLLYLDRPFSSDDSAIDQYSYLLPATDRNGQLVIVMANDTTFSLLPTVCPIPMQTQWGAIEYNSPVVVDRKARFGYVTGFDSTAYNRQYVLRIDYARHPAGITLFYTDTLEHCTNAIPVLTPDGDLILAGGIANNNYKPLEAVWLYHFTTEGASPLAPIQKARGTVEGEELCLLVAVAVAIAVLAYIYIVRRKKRSSRQVSDDELMERILQLIEQDNRYLKSLRLSNIASELGVSVATIAECISNNRGCTFAQLLAEYRVRHAQELIIGNPELKLAAVITQSGFTSESTFFRSFKAVTGKSPKEWLAEHRK